MRGLKARTKMSQAISSMFEKLEDRRLLSHTLLVGAGQTFTTIQSAVNAAHPNDTIIVYPGTYTEQVVVPSNLNGLTIEALNPIFGNNNNGNGNGNGHGDDNDQGNENGPNFNFKGPKGPSIIDAPASMSGQDAIIFDNQADNVTVEGFIIQGVATSDPKNLVYGILDTNGWNCNFNNNEILNIADPGSPSAQIGIAIQIQNGGGAYVVNNLIANYQAGGIVVANTNSAGWIFDDVVQTTPNSNVAENGIEYLNTGQGVVQGCTVSGNVNPTMASEDIGILLFNSGQVYVVDNTAYGNDGDIALVGPCREIDKPGDSTNYTDYNDGSVIEGNETYGATFDGISLFDGVNSATIDGNYSHNNGGDGLLISTQFGTTPGTAPEGNQITHNTFKNNANLDVEDQTFGVAGLVVGTNGTANFYAHNKIGTSNVPTL